MFLRKSFLIGSVLVAALFFGLPQALAQEVDCADNLDNDGDALIDCFDLDCAPTVHDCDACCDQMVTEDSRGKLICVLLCIHSAS